MIEYGSEFATLLESYHPTATVIRMDAARLSRIELQTGARAGAVISGLPLLSMPTCKVMRILDGAFRHLAPGGGVCQFAYAARCPVARPFLDRLGLRSIFIGRTMLNAPPASVYRICRRRPWMGSAQGDGAGPASTG
ncbi:phospholipid N-methyltransferase [Labrys wisconsinensis]|uniref:Phospholipid N-methyltransferase n=1 Tax=Labrys wisconsinensis TaxID=425677 RepID=A0ABU0JJZ7_9HYPH|nr:hypothetical protein [Labrys wisconsinensis]MDQ0474609.1 phospholipid N-methyltransferase [Labrys wisconsinensis]